MKTYNYQEYKLVNPSSDCLSANIRDFNLVSVIDGWSIFIHKYDADNKHPDEIMAIKEDKELIFVNGTVAFVELCLKIKNLQHLANYINDMPYDYWEDDISDIIEAKGWRDLTYRKNGDICFDMYSEKKLAMNRKEGVFEVFDVKDCY